MFPDSITPLTEELVEKARKELNEKQSEVPKSIQFLRTRILEEPDLQNFLTDDFFILAFLRARKFDPNRAFDLIKSYYKQRKHYKSLFRKLCPSSLNTIMASKYHGVLDHKDTEGRPILIFNSMSKWDPSYVTLEDVAANFLLSLELILQDASVQVTGVVALIDLSGSSLLHMRHITPSAVAQIFNVTQNTFPLRFRQVHFVNEPWFFDVVYALMKPFLTEKMKDRFIFHGEDMESLHQYLDPEILPEEFGGKTGPYDNDGWNQKLIQNQTHVERNMQFGYKKNKKDSK